MEPLPKEALTFGSLTGLCPRRALTLEGLSLRGPQPVEPHPPWGFILKELCLGEALATRRPWPLEPDGAFASEGFEALASFGTMTLREPWPLVALDFGAFALSGLHLRGPLPWEAFAAGSLIPGEPQPLEWFTRITHLAVTLWIRLKRSNAGHHRLNTRHAGAIAVLSTGGNHFLETCELNISSCESLLRNSYHRQIQGTPSKTRES